MKKLILMLLLIPGFTAIIYSQTSEDALRYSRIFYNGTSRFMGMSGAFGAVGADFSILATNPAGIGIYQSSEMSLTFAPMVNYSKSNYYGTTSTDNQMNFAMGNLGFIFTIKPYKKNSGGLKNFNFGFGINRQNDFNSRTYIEGENPKSSMMQSYVNVLNDLQVPQDEVEIKYPFDIGLAYGSNLVYFDSASNKYLCDARYGGVFQSKIINSSGSINELDFSFGGNINDKLFFGMTIGVPFIRYFETSLYQEIDLADTIREFNYLKYNYALQTNGTGVNFKAGLIYKPFEWFRVGVSIHTPTWYPNMHDEWFSSIESNFTNSSWNTIQYSPIGNYNYQLITPFRAMGSIAFIVGQYGLFSADYEYVNYSQGRFTSSGESYQDINREIQDSYQSWGNIRFGTEWRIQNLRIRGGFAYFSNPYKNGINNSERYQISGGLGYRGRHFFADVSYVWNSMKADYYLYDPALVAPAHITQYTSSVLTTIGFRF